MHKITTPYIARLRDALAYVALLLDDVHVQVDLRPFLGKPFLVTLTPADVPGIDD
jgi:hypothetical protein